MPELGAWCIVDLFDDAGKINRLAIIHPDRARASGALHTKAR
jgi:hypothetical protein